MSNDVINVKSFVLFSPQTQLNPPSVLQCDPYDGNKFVLGNLLWVYLTVFAWDKHIAWTVQSLHECNIIFYLMYLWSQISYAF